MLRRPGTLPVQLASLSLQQETNTVNQKTLFSITVKDSVVCGVQILNKRHPQMSAALEYVPHLRHKKFNKCHSAYSRKYSTYIVKRSGSTPSHLMLPI